MQGSHWVLKVGKSRENEKGIFKGLESREFCCFGLEIVCWVLIFVNLRSMTFEKKSQTLECDPDMETKIHDHRIFYNYTKFHIEKSFSVFWHKSRSLYITL